jgi:hypothetical protein
MAEHGAPAHRVVLIDAFLPDGASARAEFDQLEDDGMGYRRNIDALLSYRPPQPIDEVFEIRSATSAERLLADDAPFSELPALRRRVVIAAGDHRSITATENFDAIAPLLGASLETPS